MVVEVEKNIKDDMQIGQKKIRIGETTGEQTRKINYLFIFINTNTILNNIMFLYE
jgi:hypothetical protein